MNKNCSDFYSPGMYQSRVWTYAAVFVTCLCWFSLRALAQNPNITHPAEGDFAYVLWSLEFLSSPADFFRNSIIGNAWVRLLWCECVVEFFPIRSLSCLMCLHSNFNWQMKWPVSNFLSSRGIDVYVQFQ